MGSTVLENLISVLPFAGTARKPLMKIVMTEIQL